MVDHTMYIYEKLIKYQGSAGAVTRLHGDHGKRPVTSKILIF